MQPGRIAAWAIAAVAVPGLAACSGTSSGSSPASPGSSSAASTSSSAPSQAASQQPAAQGQAAGSGSLTPPGAHLAFGGPALIGSDELAELAGLLPELVPEQAARPGTATAAMAQAAVRPGFMVSP